MVSVAVSCKNETGGRNENSQSPHNIFDAVEADSEEGKVMLANRKDLIWLKRTRGSKQDQADIERLEHEKNR